MVLCFYAFLSFSKKYTKNIQRKRKVNIELRIDSFKYLPDVSYINKSATFVVF